MAETSGELSIREVADRTGLSPHTLRLYEREGLLLGPVRRRANGHRAYSAQDVEWIAYCTRFRASGMPWAAIRRYAELVRHGRGNEKERLALLRGHRERIRDRLEELGAALEIIDRKIGVYEEHLAHDTASELWDPTSGDR